MKVNINAGKIGNVVNAEQANVHVDGRSAGLTARRRGSRDSESREPDEIFVTYNSDDVDAVADVSAALEDAGHRVWLDTDQVLPGCRFQLRIDAAIRAARVGLVMLGTTGLGRWQELEVSALMEQAVHRDLRVVPVLLPGRSEIPAELTMLRTLSHVRLRTTNDKASLDRLFAAVAR